MKFHWSKGLIWVEIEILYRKQIIQINNRLIGIGEGTQEVLSQNIDEFRIDQKVIKNIAIEFGDINQKLGINGFIGTNILSKFILAIDFKHKILNLSIQDN